MRDRLHTIGPFSVLLGHDVGIGPGCLGANTRLVGRVWGAAVGPIALFWTRNVSRDALNVTKARKWTEEDLE